MSRFHFVKAFPRLGLIFRPWVISNAYETLAFVKTHRRWPRFKKTGYFNDLLFDLRLRESDYVFRAFTSDKEFAKIFVRGVLGEQLCVDTLDVLRTPADLDDYVPPDHCVIKPTHMSGEVVFHETGPLSDQSRQRMRQWFRFNFGDMTGERHYQRLVPKIIVEPWLQLNGAYCDDYKIYLYQGAVRAIEVKVRSSPTQAMTLQFRPDWSLLPGFSEATGLSPQDLEALRPDCLDRMIDVAQQLSRCVDVIRIDFYSDRKARFYVGEISHINANAREVFQPVETERLFVNG